MSERLEAVITARDNASATFKKVGDAAETMGKDIESSAKNSGRSLKELEQDAKSVGLGIGAMIGTLAVAGQSFRDQEIALSTLRRTYGDAATDLEAFSQALAENSNYSEEAIISAANVAATLSRNYGATAAEIQQILQISADLAATSGYAFEDAAQRVVAALRGEAEAAEMLGLTMNQQAIDRNNLTLSMSNQEAFQFRLNALTEQSAFAMGAAAEQADTTYGSMVNLEGSIRDTGQSIADSLGPLGEIGAYMADNAVQTALFGASLKLMGSGLLTTVNLLRSASSATLLGGGGLIAGLALAATGVVKLAQHFRDDYIPTAEAAEEATESWRQTVQALADDALLAGQNIGLVLAGSAITDVLEETSALSDANVALSETYVDTASSITAAAGAFAIGSEGLNALTIAQQEAADANKDGVLTFEELNAAAADLGEVLMATGETADVFAANWEAAQAPMLEIMQQQGEAGTAAREQLAQYLQYLDDGVIASSGFLTSVTEIRDAMIDQAQAAEIAAASGRPWFEVLAQQNAAMAQFSGLGQHVMDFWGGYVQATEEATEVTLTTSAALNELLGLTNADIGGGGRGASAGLRSILNVMQEITEPPSGGGRGPEMIASAFHGMSAAMLGAIPTAEELAQQISEATDEYLRLRDGIATTGEALDNGFRVIVSNTNAIASQAQSVADWADELIGVKGEYALIDDLLSDGIITLEQYNAAQEAQISIAQDAALIQSYVNEIQAEQAPILAELMSAQENYIEQIANMEGRQQLAALGFMDTAMAAQAMELQMYALSGASDEAITSVIAGAAAADPVLASMLEQMGLISIGADGTITVNVEGQSALDELSESIDRLTLITWMITMGVDAETARQQLIELLGLADDWGSSSPTASLNVMDNATKPISRAMDMLALFNGTTVTAYANVVRVGGVDRIGNGGMVSSHAHGGVTALMGEWGDELLRLGTGGTAMTRGRGLYAVPEHTYVTPAPATRQITGNYGGATVNVYVENLYGDETLAEKVSAEIVPAIQRALATRERGF